MIEAPARRIVVVDGSNLATEGRTSPSLAQLDEAVRAYAAEDPDAEIVVVVDATFEHRVDLSERAQLVEAELHGEVVSPPAGAIGRGDAFVLRIAERTGALVLSNDSFQEFHAEHPWLFDEGRLIGGKPVPGIGWIFTPRIPVRGPKSRQATGKAKREAGASLSPSAKAAELAKAARKAAAKKVAVNKRPTVLPDGSTPKVGDVWPAGPLAAEDGALASAPARKAAAKKGATKQVPAQAIATASAEPVEVAAGPNEAASKKAAAKKATAKKATETTGAAKKATAKKAIETATGAKKATAKKATETATAAKKATAKKATESAAVAKKADAAETTTRAEKTGAAKKATAGAAANAGGATHVPGAQPPAGKKAATKKAATRKAPVKEAAAEDDGRAGRRRAPADARGAAINDPRVQQAIGEAVAEAFGPTVEAPGGGQRRNGGAQRSPAAAEESVTRDGSGRQRRRAAAPPPAVNGPLAFITFVATYPLGSELEGEVVSFTSHGAMVDVELPDGGTMHSYIPLSAMGDPPPTKARQVLARGTRRTFVLVALDPPRRVAELALPDLATNGKPSRARSRG